MYVEETCDLLDKYQRLFILDRARQPLIFIYSVKQNKKQ